MKYLLIIILIFVSTVTFAGDTPNAKAVKLMKTLGIDKVAITKVNLNIKYIKKNNPNIPAEFFERFQKEVTSENILKLYSPVYAKYYSEKEMDDLMEFFNTPLGKKYISQTPEIINKASKEAEEWSREVTLKIIKEMGLNP